MIIPPDSEKDATLFSPTSSTPSLIPPPSESDIDAPPRAHLRNHAFGYPFGSSQDDLGVGYTHNGDALPPYPRSDGDLILDESRARPRSVSRPSIAIPISPARTSSDDDLTPRASGSTSRLPLDTPMTSVDASTSKLWEGSSEHRVVGKERFFPPITPGWKRWWKRWRWWICVAIGLLLAGLGLMIGLLVGLNSDQKPPPDTGQPSPWKDVTGDGKRQTNWVSTGESLNITYVPSRDGPTPPDGNITMCVSFGPLNATSPLLLLSRPFPAVNASIGRFELPLQNISSSDADSYGNAPGGSTGSTPNTSSGHLSGSVPSGSPGIAPGGVPSNASFISNTNVSSNSSDGPTIQVLPDLTFVAHGLGSSGTVEIIGKDAPDEIKAMGKEGSVVIDVVALYSGPQDLNDIIRVCQTARPDGSIGIGIYTPIETDGRVSNVYILNPTSLPSFHVVIYPPPSSLYPSNQQTISVPQITYMLDRMTVRFGDLQQVAEFGNVSINTFKGGVNGGYLAAETINIQAGGNTVSGRFNISQSLAINQTGGNIITELILHDPRNHTNESPLTPPPVYNARRNGSGFFRPIFTDLPIVSTIQTSLMTAEGLIVAAYLTQPPTVKLSALFENDQGDSIISLHPNYVGSFIVKDIWGQARIVNPAPLWESDPLAQGRSRAVTFGLINVNSGSVYAANGINSTTLEDSVVALSGAAYWMETNGTMTPVQVMNTTEAVNEVLVLNAWGDVTLSVDGK